MRTGLFLAPLELLVYRGIGLLERRLARDANGARQHLNPVRHLERTVCQRGVSVSSVAPLGWLPAKGKSSIRSRTEQERYENSI